MRLQGGRRGVRTSGRVARPPPGPQAVPRFEPGLLWGPCWGQARARCPASAFARAGERDIYSCLASQQYLILKNPVGMVILKVILFPSSSFSWYKDKTLPGKFCIFWTIHKLTFFFFPCASKTKLFLCEMYLDLWQLALLVSR